MNPLQQLHEQAEATFLPYGPNSQLQIVESYGEPEAEYAALDKEFMQLAPWVPYGTGTIPTFVSSAIDLDQVIYNPTFNQDLTSFRFK